MRPRQQRDDGQIDLLRARLDQILNMDHPLVKLAAAIDWGFLDKRLGEVYDDDPGRPPLPSRLMAGLAIVKSMHDLSDEELCERWLENPYYQMFCGEAFFQHRMAFERSSLTRWRQRMGEARLQALLQESLAAATRLKAAKPADFRSVIVDTTVQEKAIAFPTDAKLMNRARERLVKLAGKHGIVLRQSYARVGKAALIKHQRYAHAKQFKRANRHLKRLRTMLGAVIRDIDRKLARRPEVAQAFMPWLSLARRIAEQRPRQRGHKVYALHAPEVECIGKGKAHKPYEFGVKVSVATTLERSRGGQFVTHVKALPGNPYDGHTLDTVIAEIETSVGASLDRIVADAGYRGHNAPKDKMFKVHVAGQKRGLTKAIKRAFRRRAAIEPVIGHLKSDHRMGRNFLASAEGDANNAVLAAVGYNFSLLLNWLWQLLRAFFLAILAMVVTPRASLQSA
jgi:transposase, IS5 family